MKTNIETQKSGDQLNNEILPALSEAQLEFAQVLGQELANRWDWRRKLAVPTEAGHNNNTDS